MTSDDQAEAVELLTRVASVTMGLREQMDIIRIINPEATVLPTDTEFEIGTCIVNFLKVMMILLCLSYLMLAYPNMRGLSCGSPYHWG